MNSKFKKCAIGFLIISLLLNSALIYSFPINPVYADETKSGYKMMDIDLSGVIDGRIIKMNALPPLSVKIYLTSTKQAGRKIRDQVKKHTDSIIIDYRTTNSEPYDAFDEMWKYAFNETDDSSEGDYLFWQVEKMSARYVGNVNKVKGTAYYYYTFDIDVDYYTTVEQENYVTDTINNVIDEFGFQATTSEYDKVKQIYDYVCNNVTYSYDDSDIKFSAYSALANGKSVCQGYATLLYRMLKQSGISSRVVPGYGGNTTTKSDYHGWNIVKISDLYYNLDSTWDSEYAQNNESYEYFLKGDKFKAHKRFKDYSTPRFYASYPMAESAYGKNKKAVMSSQSVNAVFMLNRPVIKQVTRKYIKLKKVLDANGYQIKYSTSKKFKKKYTKIINTKRISSQFKKLKKSNKYYFKVRAFKKTSSGKVYTKWSSAKVVK